MEDKLKGFIQNHSEEANFYETDFESLWEGIENKQSGDSKKLPEESIKNPLKKHGKQAFIWKPFLQRAAVWALGMLMGAATVLYVMQKRHDGGQLAENERVAEIESYYDGLIFQKTAELKDVRPEAAEMLEMEMQEMDKAFSELKNDLKDDVANEEVINAMVKSYRLKLKILEELLNDLEPEKNENKH